MKKCFFILAFLLVFSGASLFAWHEILQGLVDDAKQVEQRTCLFTGALYTKYNQNEGSLRYSIETIALPSGDTYYRVVDSLSSGSWVFLVRAGSSDAIPSSPDEFTKYEICIAGEGAT